MAGVESTPVVFIHYIRLLRGLFYLESGQGKESPGVV